MASDGRAAGGRERYHHGDLERALVEGALRLVRERGDWSFTLRELAREVGVSHAAPYRHFADRRDLLAAVAAVGFDVLAGALREAAAAAGSPPERLRATGLAYVRFGVENPAHYRLMFGPELAGERERYPRLVEACDAAFGELTGALAACAAAGLLRREGVEVEEQALVAWALVHGLTGLVIDRWTEVRGGSRDAEELGRMATAALFQGLGVAPPPGR